MLREITHTWLEAVVGAGNPYSLIAIFGRGHLAIKTGGTVYVTRCAPVEVVSSLIRIVQRRYLLCLIVSRFSWIQYAT